MSDDLISRQAAIEEIEPYTDDIYNSTAIEIKEILQRLPSVQPKQKIGIWVHNQSKYKNRWICTECDYTWFFTKEEAKYCPNCGAKMEV